LPDAWAQGFMLVKKRGFGPSWHGAEAFTPAQATELWPTAILEAFLMIVEVRQPSQIQVGQSRSSREAAPTSGRAGAGTVPTTLLNTAP